jgi:adenosylmethionine-8-amino-7-oxononanoate aminotransferase
MPPYILDDEEIALLAGRTLAAFDATLTEAR